MGYHDRLARQAGRWLRRVGCAVVLVEARAGRGGERPDAIGWLRDLESILIECKVTADDFREEWRRIERKEFRRSPGQGVGALRYYLAPRGVIDQLAVKPTGWGLLEMWPNGAISMAWESARFETNCAQEMRLLIAAMSGPKETDCVQLALPYQW